MPIYVNNEKIKSFTFNGGEEYVHVNPCSIKNVNIIKADIYNSKALIQLLMVLSVIRQKNAYATIDLYMPYFPYARQDKIFQDGEAISPLVLLKILEAFNVRHIYVDDIHSTSIYEEFNTPEKTLINRTVVEVFKLYYHWAIHEDIHTNFFELLTRKDIIWLAPDEGAQIRVSEAARYFDALFGYAFKNRDGTTGKIKSIELRSVISNRIKNRGCFVIDDICDGGATFLMLAKLLKYAGCKELFLYVTHGIFSKGIEALTKYYDHIFCLHPFPHVTFSYKYSDKITFLGDQCKNLIRGMK